MESVKKDFEDRDISDEMQGSYLDYAMSVIVNRALPDVRDGLKPVHRRILYAMHELNNGHNQAYKKSARVVGDVIGKYHPHGDSAVYETIVRLAQDFSMRYCLVDGQGNFGSIDGDSAAAMRYTEIRMTKLTSELLADLERDTVDFSPNYDGTLLAPDVMPTRVPNLLVNGSSGIAVGMATSIPPHNLTEVVNGCLAYIDSPDITSEGLMKYIPAPDFPTSGTIMGKAGIKEAYTTGRSKITLRGQAEIETKGSKSVITITEIPYMVNKAALIEKIAELVKTGKIDGISHIRDESDKSGLTVVIEVKRDANPSIVLNNLYRLTALQSTVSMIMIALVNGEPKYLTLKDFISEFVRHRQAVVTRRSRYDLSKLLGQLHIYEGLKLAISHLDKVISTIRKANNPTEAKIQLIKLSLGGKHLTEEQAKAILEMRLHKLTSTEINNLDADISKINSEANNLRGILGSKERMMEVIKEELKAVRSNYGDKRRTKIEAAESDLTDEDLIARESVILTLSDKGYVKYQPVKEYQIQKRGGKGKSAANVKDDEMVVSMVSGMTHDTLLCFSNRGRVYWKRMFEMPAASREARGKPINNLIPLEPGERITNILPVSEFDERLHVVMVTANGIIKKTSLTEFSSPRSAGIYAIKLEKDDELMATALANGKDTVMLFSRKGMSVHFKESAIRLSSRISMGVIGMRLEEDDHIVSMVIPNKEEDDVLIVTDKGYGSRTKISEYAVKGRGIKGVQSMKVTKSTGLVVGVNQLNNQDSITIITDQGTLIRLPVTDINTTSRVTIGVKVMNVSGDETIISATVIKEPKEE